MKMRWIAFLLLTLSATLGIKPVLAAQAVNVWQYNSSGNQTQVSPSNPLPVSIAGVGPSVSSDWQQSGLTLTASNQAVVAAAGAGIKNYMTTFQVSCNAASTANTVEFEQGTTAIWDMQIPAGAGVYNSPPSMILQSAAAAAINAKDTGSVTGVCLVAATGYSQ